MSPAAELLWPSAQCPVPVLKPCPGQGTAQSKAVKSTIKFLQETMQHLLVCFFAHNRQAPLQTITGRGCPQDHCNTDCKCRPSRKPFLRLNCFYSSPLNMNGVMPTLHFYALVSHGLGFCIPLSHTYDVKEKSMFALYVLLTAAKMRTQG